MLSQEKYSPISLANIVVKTPQQNTNTLNSATYKVYYTSQKVRFISDPRAAQYTKIK